MFCCVFFLLCWFNGLSQSWPLQVNSPCTTSLLTAVLRAPEVEAGHILFSSSYSYSVLELIREGSFGKVAKCFNVETSETVAVKILKDTDGNRNPDKEVDFWTPLDLTPHPLCIPLLRVSMLQCSMYSELLMFPLFPSGVHVRDYQCPWSRSLQHGEILWAIWTSGTDLSSTWNARWEPWRPAPRTGWEATVREGNPTNSKAGMQDWYKKEQCCVILLNFYSSVAKSLISMLII